MAIDTNLDGNPESIRSVANWLRQHMKDSVENAADSVYSARNAADSGWRGETADGFRNKMTTGGRQADEFKTQISTSAQQADTGADQLQRAQKDMQRIRSEASTAGLTVSGKTIHEPGQAPADPGPAPTGDEATPKAIHAHKNAVAVADEHAAQVKAYKTAEDDANDVHRRWQQQVQSHMSDWQNTKNKAIFTVSGLGISGGTTAASIHTSILGKHASALDAESVKAADHARVIGGTDPEGFYRNLDAAKSMSREAGGVRTRAGKIGKVAGRVSNIGGGALAVGGIAYDITNGKPADQAIVSGGAGFGASVGTGALVGTAIGGPVGTAIGAVGGAAVGAFTSGTIDSLYENGIGHIGEAAKDGAESVVNTGKAIGSLGKDVGESIGSGVKDAWNSIF